MKPLINKGKFNKFKSITLSTIRSSYYFIKSEYRHFISSKHFIFVLKIISYGAFVCLLLPILFLIVDHSTTVSKNHSPVHFDAILKKHTPIDKSDFFLAHHQTHKPIWQVKMATIEHRSDARYIDLMHQLQSIQYQLKQLASRQSMQHLQQQVLQPTQTLLGKVDDLQHSVEHIVKQTNKSIKKKWILPKKVERYFQLVAIQGFSDGMRAIIDVDGNQTALSINEPCPVCRGWVLRRMSFSNQSAIFNKKINGHVLYVKLKVN